MSMHSYLDLVGKVRLFGKKRSNRTGVDALSFFGLTFKHDMQEGLPFVTVKKLNYRACIYELLWFLKGNTNIKYLVDNGVHIWDAWADKEGNLGPVYGKQWRDSGLKHIDQVQQVIDTIKKDPYSRRLIIDAWSPSELDDMALPPCHILYQFYVEPSEGTLNLSVYMRSADLFLGVPFDIAEGSLLLSLVAKVTGYVPSKLIYTFGDAHIYVNHISAVDTMLRNSPYALPTLNLPFKDSIFDYTFEDFEILNYKSHPFIKADVAI